MKLYAVALPPLFFSGVVLLSQGCGTAGLPNENSAQLMRQDNWTVVGEVADSRYKNGEAVAISGDGARYRTGITKDHNFGLELPGNTNYALYFLPASPASENKTPALLHFEADQNAELANTLRLPEPLRDHVVDLGEIDVNNKTAYPTKNPASRLDFDRDGLSDLKDRDDQNDGIADDDQKNDRLEKIEVCHINEDNIAQTLIVDLPALYAHIEHGDSPWSCRKARPSIGTHTHTQRIKNEDYGSEDAR